jgi:hypothetical protein
MGWCVGRRRYGLGEGASRRMRGRLGVPPMGGQLGPAESVLSLGGGTVAGVWGAVGADWVRVGFSR